MVDRLMTSTPTGVTSYDVIGDELVRRVHHVTPANYSKQQLIKRQIMEFGISASCTNDIKT